MFQVLSIYFKTHVQRQVAGAPPIPVTRTAFGLPPKKQDIHSLKLTYSLPQKMVVSNRNLQTSRGLCSGGELLVSGRVAEKRATLRKTNAACENGALGDYFPFGLEGLFVGDYISFGETTVSAVSYHITSVSYHRKGSATPHWMRLNATLSLSIQEHSYSKDLIGTLNPILGRGLGS